MPHVLVENGTVIGLDLTDSPPAGYVIAPDYVSPGFTFDGLAFSAPTSLPYEPVPPGISDRQFFHILALDGLITEAEALTAVKTGDAPEAFEAFIASLPETERFSARMLVEGATTFERAHPLTDAFGALYGMTPEEIDDLWRRAAAL